MLEFFVRLQSLLTVQKEKGATAVEYGLIVALIAAIIVVAVGTLGGQINTAFEAVVNVLPGAPAGP